MMIHLTNSRITIKTAESPMNQQVHLLNFLLNQNKNSTQIDKKKNEK